MASFVNKLGIASEERKIRLAQLRSLKRKQPDDESAPPESERKSPKQDDTDVAHKLLSGRNYDFETQGPKLGFDTMPNEGLEKPTLEEQATEVEAQVKHDAAEKAQDDKGLDLFKLQPKKPNWDLKRNLDQKLEILNVRTDNAIARLVRERLKNSKEAAQKGKAVQNGKAEAGVESLPINGSDLVRNLRAREKEAEELDKKERRI